MQSPNPPAPSAPHRQPPRQPGAVRSQLPDAAVLEAALAGDQKAWAEFVTRYSRLVYSIPRRYGLDVHASEDVFQEVFSIFVRQAPGVRNRHGLPKWFITTTHRVCRGSYLTARQAAPEGPPAEAEPPADLVARWEQQHAVRRALGRLGGRCEQLIVALYAEHGPASYAEIGRRLGMPTGAIGPTRARCLEKLTKLLEEQRRGD